MTERSAADAISEGAAPSETATCQSCSAPLASAAERSSGVCDPCVRKVYGCGAWLVLAAWVALNVLVALPLWLRVTGVVIQIALAAWALRAAVRARSKSRVFHALAALAHGLLLLLSAPL